MSTAILILVGIIAVQHFAFLILEMFFWTKPIGLKIFKMDEALARSTATLAANQGLYNGFLASGLVWSLVVNSPEFSYSLKLFFLGCIYVAGVYGWYSVSRTILYIQALPAALALVLLFFY